MEKGKVSEHFMRLGMTEEMRQRIEAWRAAQIATAGSIPSFSGAVRLLIERGLTQDAD